MALSRHLIRSNVVHSLTLLVVLVGLIGAGRSGLAQSPGQTGTSGQPAGGALTLADVVRIAVGNNTGLIAARQRLQEAQELVAQVNAQGRPQISAYAQDTDASYKTFPPGLVFPLIASPTVPQVTIPPVVDAAGSFPGAFAGGGSASTIGAAPGMAPQTSGSLPTPPTTVPDPKTPPSDGTTPMPAGRSGSIGSPAGKQSTASAVTVVPPILVGFVTQPLEDTPTPGLAASVVHVASGEPAPAVDHPSEMPDASPLGSTADGTRTGPVPDAASSTSAPSTPKPQNNDWGARASITQYIDLFGLVPAARGTEEAVRDFYALDIDRLRNETALVAKNLFFNVLYAQAQVDTAQEQVDYAQEDVRITKSRLAQGIDSNFDVLTAQTALSTAQQQLTAAEDQRDLAQATLAYLLGSDPEKPLTLTPPLLPSLDETVDLQQSTATALLSRPEIRQADADIREARDMVKVAGASLLPTFGIVGSGVENNTATASTPQNYAEISAELAVPLDDGGVTRSHVRSARVGVQAQILTLYQLQQSVCLEVREAAVNIRNAQAQVTSAQAGVTSAQEALRLARERYQAGLGTFLDVLNALSQLGVTRTNLSTAQYEYQASLAQMVRAIGER
ncbi:MAG: TolC family protein [Capsulimonadaceae bacterium]